MVFPKIVKLDWREITETVSLLNNNSLKPTVFYISFILPLRLLSKQSTTKLFKEGSC